MRLKVGQKVRNIKLMDITGIKFDLESLSGKPYMLTFYRFTSCPFCNLRVNNLVKRFNELDKDFTPVAIFKADLEELTRHTEKHLATFPVLADPHGRYYKKFGIEESVKGFFTGMIMRLPTLLKSIFIKGYLPNLFTGGLTIMPADFLVDREGIIQVAYYGNDEGDHLDFETIKKFSFGAVST